MINTTAAKNGKAQTVRSTFSRVTHIEININAEPAIIWALLTNAGDYARWNSTIISIEGKIAPGEKIILKSKLDPKRAFKLKVKAFEPNRRLAWGDAMGNRIYTLHQYNTGTTNFTMTEKIGGPLFPLFAGTIPPFDEAFEKFAADLKDEAEKITNQK